MKLTQHNCTYCGALPNNCFNRGSVADGASQFQLTEGNFTYNGLDRLDSSRGHSLDNVVPCCHTCNLMKTNMGVEAFLAHIERIHSNLASIRVRLGLT